MLQPRTPAQRRTDWVHPQASGSDSLSELREATTNFQCSHSAVATACHGRPSTRPTARTSCPVSGLSSTELKGIRPGAAWKSQAWHCGNGIIWRGALPDCWVWPRPPQAEKAGAPASRTTRWRAGAGRGGGRCQACPGIRGLHRTSCVPRYKRGGSGVKTGGVMTWASQRQPPGCCRCESSGSADAGGRVCAAGPLDFGAWTSSAMGLGAEGGWGCMRKVDVSRWEGALWAGHARSHPMPRRATSPLEPTLNPLQLVSQCQTGHTLRQHRAIAR